ncbi:MAG TPA: beta-N-acetylhexosaminidase [Candidatus Angelobacter sp.]|nr:beta-N-acetylhexosaminidase [Candidatus Angelobacter sp.]
MPLTLEQAVGQQFLLSFEGTDEIPKELKQIMQRQHVGGVILFRHKNISTPPQVRELTSALQQTAHDSGQPPVLIAADQEGGQLMAIGDGTPFPGNMALGATLSENLAYATGRALGRELSALGVNVDFAPVCDVNNNPRNPVIGTRSFGEDPRLVAKLSAAMIRGLQSAGVAATAKHFPGHGDTASDSHRGAPVLKHDRRRIHSLELVPFRSAIQSNVRLIMPGHIIMPALNGGSAEIPGTVSAEILQALLRRKMKFNGVVVSDALDMHALEQGSGYIAEAMAAAHAGIDLLLFNHQLDRVEPAWANMVQAVRRGLLSEEAVRSSARRILDLKKWIAKQSRPQLEIVACEQHQQLAQHIARKSVTLVRNDAEELPLRVSPDAKIAVAVPVPDDLTPADTSSYVKIGLAEALRRYHAAVAAVTFRLNPDPADISQVCEKLASFDVVIVGTINAAEHRGQAELVKKLIRQSGRMITVALRMPYDLAAYPAARTHICTYSILPPSMEALAEAIFGQIPFLGVLPVTLASR